MMPLVMPKFFVTLYPSSSNAVVTIPCSIVVVIYRNGSTIALTFLVLGIAGLRAYEGVQ